MIDSTITVVSNEKYFLLSHPIHTEKILNLSMFRVVRVVPGKSKPSSTLQGIGLLTENNVCFGQATFLLKY